MVSFKAQVLNFTTKTERDTGLVFASAVDKLVKEVKKNRKTGGGLTPADTGNMIRSIKTSTTSMPQVDKELKEYAETTFSIGPNAVGKPVYIGVQAAYGPRMNYGFVGTDALGRYYNQTGAFFIEGAGDKWPQFVKQSERELA